MPRKHVGVAQSENRAEDERDEFHSENLRSGAKSLGGQAITRERLN